jgi:hypothetical protein
MNTAPTARKNKQSLFFKKLTPNTDGEESPNQWSFFKKYRKDPGSPSDSSGGSDNDQQLSPKRTLNGIHEKKKKKAKKKERKDRSLLSMSLDTIPEPPNDFSGKTFPVKGQGALSP